MDTGIDVRKRLLELSEKSYRENRYVFTDFLNVSQLSGYYEMKREFAQSGSSVFGGMDGCERCIVRFGSEELFGYEQDYPIVVLKISPVNRKFAENLGHRDFLGSIIGLGLEREKLGDIFVSKDEKYRGDAYAFVVDSIADYIIENLGYVRHTHIKVEICNDIPDDICFHLEDASIIVSSNRLDAIIAKIYNMSRDKALKCITEGKVFVNGITMTGNSRPLKAGEVVSVRGEGKFIFRSEGGQTKKDKLYVNISKYV